MGDPEDRPVIGIKKSVILPEDVWKDISMLQHEEFVGSQAEMFRRIVRAGIIAIRTARRMEREPPTPTIRGRR